MLLLRKKNYYYVSAHTTWRYTYVISSPIQYSRSCHCKTTDIEANIIILFRTVRFKPIWRFKNLRWRNLTERCCNLPTCVGCQPCRITTRLSSKYKSANIYVAIYSNTLKFRMYVYCSVVYYYVRFGCFVCTYLPTWLNEKKKHSVCYVSSVYE